jgi:fumarate hydratase, class II
MADSLRGPDHVHGWDTEVGPATALSTRSLTETRTDVPSLRRVLSLAAAIAHHAHNDGITVREAAIASGLISSLDFDRLTDPATMSTCPS